MLAIQEYKPFDINEIQIEDGKPVDNLLSEKQMRLLTEPLYSSWKPQTSFLVASDVGIFSSIIHGGIAPDVFLSLGVESHLSNKNEDKCYYLDKIGKAPEVVIEIVSNKEGGERTSKVDIYRKLGIMYYVIYDPYRYLLKTQDLLCYKYENELLIIEREFQFPEVGIGLCIWKGVYEGAEGSWLRWCDGKRQIIPTGEEARVMEQAEKEKERERAERERERAELERGRAEKERERAELERGRAEREKERAELERGRAETANKQIEQSIQKMFQKGMPIPEIAEIFCMGIDQVKAFLESE